jgi:hypothetical protein
VGALEEEGCAQRGAPAASKTLLLSVPAQTRLSARQGQSGFSLIGSFTLMMTNSVKYIIISLKLIDNRSKQYNILINDINLNDRVVNPPVLELEVLLRVVPI